MHMLRHEDEALTFGVHVFGSDRNNLECSYGMPGAADFSRVDVPSNVSQPDPIVQPGPVIDANYRKYLRMRARSFIRKCNISNNLVKQLNCKVWLRNDYVLVAHVTLFVMTRGGVWRCL